MKVLLATKIIYCLYSNGMGTEAEEFMQYCIDSMDKKQFPQLIPLSRDQEKGETKVQNMHILENGIEVDLSDGWVPWEGGECPIDKDSIVNVICRNGDRINGYLASYLIWHEEESGNDVVAYKIVE